MAERWGLYLGPMICLVIFQLTRVFIVTYKGLYEVLNLKATMLYFLGLLSPEPHYLRLHAHLSPVLLIFGTMCFPTGKERLDVSPESADRGLLF